MHLTEQDFFRRTNEQQLSKFDQKFKDFQKELTFLNDENIRIKDKEKKQKRLAQELEVELLAWKEKHRYSEDRCRELQAKFEGMSREMVQLRHENEKQIIFNAV